MRKLNILKAEVQKGTTNKDLRDVLSEANLKVEIPYSSDISSDNEEFLMQRAKDKMDTINQKVNAANQLIINSSRNYLVQLATQKYNMSKVILENARNPVNVFTDNNKLNITNYFQIRK